MENKHISIYVKNLSADQIIFLDAVVIPHLVEVLLNDGLEVTRVECVINRPVKLCNGKCKECAFEEVCNEREVA